MNNKTSIFWKQILSVLNSVSKVKSVALKSKTSAMKARLILFSLLRNKKVLMSSIAHKIHVLLGQQDNEAIVVYNAMASESNQIPICTESVEKEDKYPDLTYSFLNSDGDGLEGKTESVIELVRNSKEEEGGDFRLEDEIDHVADLFIRRFHRQMKMQKLESFKRYQDMLDRSV